MVLVKEDGSGKTDANTYALVADADAFHEGHLYATAWTGASIANKEKALVLATRLIDASYDFNGVQNDEGLMTNVENDEARRTNQGFVILSSLVIRILSFMACRWLAVMCGSTWLCRIRNESAFPTCSALPGRDAR